MDEEIQIKKYMQSILQEICDTIGPRPPCSSEEAQCANYLKAELIKATPLTEIEKFSSHPSSYRAQFRIPMIAIIIATFSYWFYWLIPNFFVLIIPLGFLLFSLIVIQTNIMRNIGFIDSLFKAEQSCNIFAKFIPTGIIKHRLIIGGHHDSNWEFPLLRRSLLLFGLTVVLVNTLPYLLCGIFFLKILLHFSSTPYLFHPTVDLTILIILSILSPLFFYGTFNFVSKRPVMGADDNLSALAVILALGSYLKTHPLAQTEIWLVSHGCEEIGDRGSKEFAKTHFKEIKDALVINLDMIGGKNNIFRFVTAEMVLLVKLSKEIAGQLVEIAIELGIQHQLGSVEAFTDSMAYAQNGIKACSIVGLPEKGFPSHYHTRHDTLDKINIENLWKCYTLLVAFIHKLDANKFPHSSSK